MRIVQDRLDALERGEITLDTGVHASFEDGHCAMEVVAWLAGLGHTDAPVCVSPVLRAFTTILNDQWGAGQRQELVRFLPGMVGTADDGQDEARSYMALDWLIRTFTSAWLDVAGLGEDARKLRGLRRIVDMDSARAAVPMVRFARDAARYAVGSAVRSAARDAALDAALYAAGYAVRSAALVAALDAAGYAAGDAAGYAARYAARDAVRSAALYAAGVAALYAALDAAGVALRPTVGALQESALDLLCRMIDPNAE